MFAKMTIASAAAMLLTTTAGAQLLPPAAGQAPPRPAIAPVPQIDPALPPPAAPPGAPDDVDLQKQVEEALKQIEKLDKVIPDDVRERMRQGILNNRPGIAARPGFRANTNTAYLLGMTIQRPIPILAEQLQLPPMQGQVLADVRAETAAAKAGFQRFDILTELNGKPVSSDTLAFNQDLRELKPGADVTATVIRQGKKETIKSFKVPEGVIQPGVPQAVPQAPPQAVPQIAPNIGGNFGGGGITINGVRLDGRFDRVQSFNKGGETMVLGVAGDVFKADYRKGALHAVVQGKLDNTGKATLTEAVIHGGGPVVTARSLAEVPAQHRATIESILARVK